MRPELEQALTEGSVTVHGSTAGWAAWLAVQVAARDPMVVVVAPDDEMARRLETEIRFFWGQVHDPAAMLDEIAALPGIDVSPYADLSPDRDLLVERVATLYRLAKPELQPRIVVTSADALVRKTLLPAELASRGRTIRVGEMIDRDELLGLLTAAGWSRLPITDERGTFAVRGGVIDMFAPLSPHPVRIEMLGDEIESLRWFDAESQRTLRPVDWVHLHPVRETIATGTRDVRTRLREYADEIAHPTKATRRLIEQLEAGEVFVGIEALTPAFHDAMVAPAAYIPAEARWITVDPAACKRVIVDAWVDAEARFPQRQSAASSGHKPIAYPPAAHLATADEAGPFTAQHQAAHVGHGFAQRVIHLPILELHEPGPSVRVEIDDLRDLKAELDHARTFGDTEHAQPLIDALARWRKQGMRVAIASDSQSRTDRLVGVLTARGIDVRIATPNERPTSSPGVAIIAGAPAHSFASPKDHVALVTAADIFGQRTHHGTATKRKRARDALLGGVGDFSQLEAGDYLVHQRHGVGRYLGLERLDVVGATNIETLKLEYDGGNLYLPVYRLGEVQRYVGSEGHAPKLDKLGGVTWLATRTKVARHIQALAEELLQLYAQRASLPGHRFPPADDSFRELEATFPFDETPDQAAAIEAVLGDMEAPRAMDRLVCGDVGYGKTEVALRAVFRCVMGGKQACILAPTTVLVEQHFRTMTERFGGFPVNLGRLSRFQSKTEQIDTVKKLADGKLDVVVGTHRVLSPDVRFKDLGLLVIDEEQRFGVAHKEKIKKTRTQVDVLTLTATPIPRTLHLAMANLRDLSIIATPPADRRAVRTFVSRVDDTTIREAIERELARGGQVFFITPTIGNMPLRAPDPRLPNDSRPQRRRPRDDDFTIDEWADYVKRLVPTARVGIGHGSLGAEELEKVMLQFVKQELDVLVATTIVESGLDIPRANTMFIARADAFGLAQLYQLRGRIGRSRDRAYCYLLVPEPEHITEEARRRLETLQRFTELGAGFQIASQDLEIRGGGELLGAKQSGSIAAVGFDQYVRMLDAAVAELNGKPIHSAIDPELSIEMPGFIPDDYVPDPGQRLELYKRLSAVDTDEDLAAVMAEISDRYGPWPGEVVLLGELMGVKAIARSMGALALEISTARVALALPDDSKLPPQLLAAGWRRLPDGRFAIVPTSPGGATGARRSLLDALARAT